jgi:tetratricopeptide (TPR) repeat protein
MPVPAWRVRFAEYQNCYWIWLKNIISIKGNNMSEKLTKEDLKSPDVFQSTFEKLGDYISENQTRVIVTASALICAVILVMGIYFYWSHYSNSALKLYAKAQGNVLKSEETQVNVDENIKLYKELANKYPYSWSGRMANYHLGNIFYNKGEMDQAISFYKIFVKKAGSDKTGVKFLALTSLGYAYETKNDYNQALKYFEEAQNVYHVGFEMIG